MKRIVFWIAGILAVVGLGLRLPGIFSNMLLNRTGLQAGEVCLSGEGQGTPGSTGSRFEFFDTAGRVCAGEGDWTLDELESMLVERPDRLPVAAAIAPHEERLAQLAIDIEPDNPAGYRWLAEIQTAAGMVDQAIESYRTLLTLSPRDSTAWVLLGKLYVLQGDHTQAATAFDEACELRDLGRNGCLNAGHAYYALGEYQTAVDRYDQAFVQNRGPFLQAVIGQAKAFIALGQNDVAADLLAPLAETGQADALRLLESIQEVQSP